ncbi:DUF1638 domain-containing protein [Methanothrix sp.]|uniref:DUF1638 domain-containing protein n=1 Tax=Methanothrix sp. TaxID=90426 RepID=UPI003C73D461
MSTAEYSLVACGVFRKEIERISGELDFSFDPVYLDPGLHVDFDELALRLREVLESCKDDRVIVVYGACHPKMNDLLRGFRAELIDCQNCIDAFITRREVERIASEGLYFYLTPGWVDCWREIFRRLGWGMEEARLEMGSFKGVIFIDTLGNADAYEKDLLEFMDFTLLQYSIIPGKLDHFRSLISDAAKRLEVRYG